MSYKKRRTSATPAHSPVIWTRHAFYKVSPEQQAEYTAQRDTHAAKRWAISVIVMCLVLGGLYAVVVVSYGQVIIRALQSL